MKHNYKNFNATPSEVPNDMPWSNTRWANFNNKNETITLDHHNSNLGPNMVLSLPDSDNMSNNPDSDEWSNHPGLFGWTWWGRKKKFAERDRVEQGSVDSQYPNTGNCAVLTSSADRLNDNIDSLYAEQESIRGARKKREHARKISTRETRLDSIIPAQTATCAQEAQDAARDQEMANIFLGGQQQPKSGGLSPTNILIGALVIGAVIYGISKMGKSKKD